MEFDNRIGLIKKVTDYEVIIVGVYKEFFQCCSLSKTSNIGPTNLYLSYQWEILTDIFVGEL